jgi:uncharacterized protein (TIGR00369 family)
MLDSRTSNLHPGHPRKDIGRAWASQGDRLFRCADFTYEVSKFHYEVGRDMKPRAELSKVELARADERLRHSAPINHFGFQLAKAERGRAVFKMPVLEKHKQIHRVVHGGVVAMLADTAGGFAAFLASPAGSRVVTIEMKINFLEAVERGELKADARVLRQGRTTSVVDCNVTDSDGRLVSKALMTFSVSMPRKSFGRTQK